MPFTVLGDPDYKTSLKIIKQFIDNGADFLELGIPFSDPPADGPVIQLADQRAIKSGMNTDKAFSLIQEVRRHTDIPIGLLVYYNLVFKYGVKKFYTAAARAGVNSILIADLPLEEYEPASKAARASKIDPIFMVSELTTETRLKKILKYARGFLYLVSYLGVTGSQKKRVNSKKLFPKLKSIQTSLYF